MNQPIDIIGGISTAISKLLYFVFATALGVLAVIVAPVLAIVLPVYVIHTGNVENIKLLSSAYILVGPLSASFYFSCVWKGFKRGEEGFVTGIIGAAGRMILGFILSVGSMLAVGLNFHPTSAPVWFVVNFLAISAPVLLVAIIKLARKNENASATNVCFLCDGRVRGTSCVKCGADYSTV